MHLPACTDSPPYLLIPPCVCVCLDWPRSVSPLSLKGLLSTSFKVGFSATGNRFQPSLGKDFATWSPSPLGSRKRHPGQSHLAW